LLSLNVNDLKGALKEKLGEEAKKQLGKIGEDLTKDLPPDAAKTVQDILKDPSSILPAAGSRLASMVLSGVLRGLERFTGIGLVREVGDFVRVIEDLTEGLRARVRQVDALIKSDTTALLLVTAPEPHLIGETAELAKALAAVQLRVHGVVVNRMLPRAVYGPDAPKPPPLAGVDAPLRRRLEHAFDDLRTLAARQEAVLEPLLRTASAPVVAEVPLLTTPPGSLADLEIVSGYLTPDPPAVTCAPAASAQASSAARRPASGRPRAGRP